MVIPLILLSLKCYAVSVTLRLRMPNGQVSRIEADDDESMGDFRARLQREGKIPSGSCVAVKGTTYDDENERSGSSLSDLGVANGEIMSVLGGELGDADKSTTKSSSGGKRRGAKESTDATGRKSSKSMSNADIEERRKSLTKIARQKSTGKRYVSVTSTAGNVLKRLAFSKRGGVALLVGRAIREKDSETVKTSTARERALAKVNKKLPSSSDSDELGRECIEVHAMFELVHEEGSSSMKNQDLSTDATVKSVSEMAKKMGLSIVGVGVSVGTNYCISKKGKGKGKDKACVWSPAHVHRALQVRDAVFPAPNMAKKGTKDKSPLFCVLGVAQRTAEDDAAAAGGGKAAKPKVDRATRDANPELVMEAFELSKQALELYDKGILTKVPVAASDGAGGGEEGSGGDQQGGEKERSRGRPVLNKMNMAGPGSASGSPKGSEQGAGKKSEASVELLRLAGAVLTQSDESTAVDPLLLAVPLPIVAIDANAPTVKKKEDKSAVQNRAGRGKGGSSQQEEQWRPASLGLTFEHSFPSPSEMGQDSERCEAAEAHLCDVCEQLSSPAQPRHAAMFLRLRDIHIMHRLAQLMEAGALSKLCAAVGQAGCGSLPGELGPSFELLQLSLSASASSSSSSSAQGTGKASKVRKRPARRITREMRARGETGDDDLEEI